MPETDISLHTGRVLYVSGSEIWMSKRQRLFVSHDGGLSCNPHAKLPLTCAREWLTALPYGTRLGRVGFHHFIKTSASSAIIIAHRGIFALDIGQKRLKQVARLHGSRPLSLCIHEDRLYYGEYRSNPERSPVHVWSSNINGQDWQPIWQFNHIRHVHGVYHDPYTSSMWVTTGDEDSESAIWCTDDQFKSLRKVAGGSQMQRTIKLLFTKTHIYFGSDAPEKQNYIWRMKRADLQLERLCAVGGSVFSGTIIGEHLFFATAVEPSTTNRSRFVELWTSPNGESWAISKKYRKDMLPMKYFQYGQIFFPNGPGDDNHLWYTPFSTQNNEHTFRITLPHDNSTNLQAALSFAHSPTIDA